MPGTGIRSASYLIPRTAALLIILAQIPAASADLSDPLFFFTAVSAALLIAVLLFYKRAGTAETLIIIGLVPWAARFLVAAPRWFAPRLAWVTLDSLLLNLDRNNFTALLPFYWTAASSWFCLKHKNFLKYDILIVDLFFLVFLCAAPAVMAPAAITPSVSMSAAFLDFYRWPVLMIGLFGLAFFLQILSLIFSAPPEFTIGKTEKIAASAAALILVIIGCLFFIRPSQEKAAEKGGGLLEPNLFRFDFSQFLRLDPQISMNDDLILIVKKDTLDDHTLLRRFTLSGYSPEQGFYRKETVDEKAHPQKLPRVRTILPQRDDINDYNEIEQEYFLVNFDPSAFIGMNMPVEVTPYQIWDTASFGSAYKVSSRVSEAGASELFDAAGSVQSPDALGLSEEDYRFYTDYGGDQDYAALAREITKDSSGNYWLETEEIFEYLKYGDFRYSLKPGIAPDGNQLKYFLLNTKKGYCSYYAFAFALMLRSLGIPCRVAAGFFIDNETEVFNYYPVRANMAHAWVEVWFPRYGWIEYDPTSNEMAQGEDFIFGNGKPEQFENLLKEILDNRSALKVMEGYAENAQDSKAGLGQNTVLFLKSRGPCLFIILFIGILLFYRCLYLWLGLSAMIVNNPAAGARYLMAHSKRRLRLAGFKKGRGLADAEWAALPVIDGFYDLYKDCAAARFAPAYSRQDFLKMKTDYRCFDTAMRRKIPLPRRLVSWIFPLALLLPEPRQNGRQPEAGMFKLLLIIFMVFIISPGRAQDRQPQDLLLEADRAREAENWDRAAELYTLGTKLFPDVLDFPLSLGDIFYNRKLYHLAWNEYRLCEKISPNDTDILFQLARTAGYLNMNEESARYLEKVVAVIPDNREAIGSLGWIYFKIHRLSDGERLLLSAIDRIGPDPDFSMTLGTIYTDLFDYQKAKKWYLDAVSSAEGTAIAEGPAAAEGSAGSAGNGAAGDRVFAAVAHYNLSILESRFYEYDNAYDQANLSLNAFNRASGRLARGELYLRRMELPRTLAEYQAAYGMDTSPLSKLNLAEVLMIGGRLDEARLYAQDCLSG
ncbi:MAG: hypothetical protein FWD78_13470, partial [Treponema sp.]|nr:hypothetical protein [Treponema sp.]